MRRDFELIRTILLLVERGEFDAGSSHPDLRAFSETVVAEHILLMHEANLIESTRLSGVPATYRVSGITLEGAKFLSLVRNASRWSEIKATAARVDAPLSGDTIVLIALKLDQRHER